MLVSFATRALASFAVLATLADSSTNTAQLSSRSPLLPPAWDTGFGYPGVGPDALDMALFDDGTGEKLYVCGDLRVAGNTAVDKLAAWDGDAWEAIAAYPSLGGIGFVDMAVYDSGSGPRLFATNGTSIGAWDGTSWEVFSVTGSGGWEVKVLFSYGSKLYAGGRFSTIDGVAVKSIANYDGTQWNAMGLGVGQGLPWKVQDIAVSDATGTPRLYAGIDWTSGATDKLYWWDGVDWNAVAGTPDSIYALAHFDSPTGSELIIGASGVPLQKLTSSGVTTLHPDAPTAFDLTTETVGSTPTLIAMGSFSHIGTLRVNGFASWDGSAWAPAGGAANTELRGATATTIADLGNGSERFVIGTVSKSVGFPQRCVATWRSGAWHALGTGESIRDNDFAGTVEAIAEFDDGSGSKLYISGAFSEAGSAEATDLARWNGSGWETTAGGSPINLMREFAVWDDGGGSQLYVGGGLFSTSAGIARWDGTTWSIPDLGIYGQVEAMAIYDDGTGPALYAGGLFTQAGGAPADNLARWDGTSWTGFDVTGPVYALEVFDDGNGPRLFVGGFISEVAPGVSANHVAAWDGTSWDTLQGGVDDVVHELLAVDLPEVGGERLLAAGEFTGGLESWSGAAWEGSLGFPTLVGDVMSVWNDGARPRLYVAGHALGTPWPNTSLLYTLDASGWKKVGQAEPTTTAPPGPTEAIRVLYSDGKQRSSLWIGGRFATVDGETGSVGIARRFRRPQPFDFQIQAGPSQAGLTRAPALVGEVDANTLETVVRIEGAPAAGEAIFFIGTDAKTVQDGVAVEALWHHRVDLGQGPAELRGSLPRDLGTAGLVVQALIREPGSQPLWTATLRITATEAASSE